MSDDVTVLLADDHPMFRAGVRETLRAGGMHRVVGEAGDGAAALEMIEKLRPRVAILDQNMPRMNGLEVAREAQRRGLSTTIVLLTMHEDGELLRAALQAGVKGYVLKESAVSDLVTCLGYVSAGRTYLSPGLSDLLVDSITKADRAPGPLDAITPAERRILELIAKGRTSKQIATLLDITVKTVENHRSNMCVRLGLNGTNALLRFITEHRTLFET